MIKVILVARLRSKADEFLKFIGVPRHIINTNIIIVSDDKEIRGFRNLPYHIFNLPNKFGELKQILDIGECYEIDLKEFEKIIKDIIWKSRK